MSLNGHDTQNHKRLLKPLFLVPTKEAVQKANAMTQALEIIDANKPCAAEAKREALQLVRNSLVKRTQSSTGIISDLYEKQRKKKRDFVKDRKSKKLKAASVEKQAFEANLHTCPEPLSLASRKTISKTAHFNNSIDSNHAQTPNGTYPPIMGLIDYQSGEIKEKSATCVRMYHQEWSGNYRLGLETGALGAKSAPPTVTGERLTESLSSKAVKSILESGAYMSACRGGYTTFLTLTFSNEARKKILDIVAIPQGKEKSYKWGNVRCIDGVPSDYATTNNNLDIEKAENIKAYCNGTPASGAFSSVEFAPISTIGKEVSRFFDASQKIYQRGWLPRFKEVETRKSKAANMVIYSGTKQKVKSALPMFCPEYVDPLTNDGTQFDEESELIKYNPRKHSSSEYLSNIYGQQIKQAPLDYMWVAEMPENEQGEKNPHVHVMMRWQVEKPVFRAWAERLESVWGHGFAKLERIKTPQAASNYLLKAVGYLTKGGSSEQGVIRGNRYGISASARAPKWECIGEFYADNFMAILGELREKLHRKKAKINAQALACSQQRDIEKGLVKKLTNINKKTPTEKRHAYIERLKARLLEGDKVITESKNKVSELPFINDFAIGNLDENQAADFISWSMRKRFWNGEVKSNQYNTWDELKRSTIEAVKENRRYWYGYAHILETSELTWKWAEKNSRYERIQEYDNVIIDENGREWERVA